MPSLSSVSGLRSHECFSMFASDPYYSVISNEQRNRGTRQIGYIYLKNESIIDFSTEV